MYNKYIIPVCEINDSKIYNMTVVANSIEDCRDKIMEKFADYSNSYGWGQFVKDLDKQDILIGDITDLEIL